MTRGRDWENFVEQDVREIRQRFLRERIQVSRKGTGNLPPNLRQISPTSAVAAEWFRSLGLRRQLVVRGAAASQESRKAVLVGPWAAAQWGMWFIPPKDHSVLFALPSGYQPSKSMLPHGVRFKSMKLREEEVEELDGVRVTDPLRTYLDMCRLRQNSNAWLAAGWLLERGLTAEGISAYARDFEGPLHPNRKRMAASLPHTAKELKSYRYLLAYSLLLDSPVRVRINCELDEMGHAVLLAGNDLVIAVDEDPLFRELEEEPHGRMLARNLRKRERWTAARGYRKLHFTTREIEADPEGFVGEVLGARRLRRRDLSF